MLDKMTVGNISQKYVSAKTKEGAYDECISGVFQSMVEIAL